MGKKRERRPTRRELRTQRRDEKREAAEAEQAALARRRRLLSLIGVGTVGAVVAAYLTELPRYTMGFALLAGIGLFLAVALGGLGGAIQPRDRSRAGNIDYGR